MTLRKHAEELLHALATNFGLGTLALNAHDSVFLSCGEMSSLLAFSEEGEGLLLVSYLGGLPTGENREKASRMLLEGTFNWGGTGGGTLGLDDDTGMLCLSRRFMLPETSARVFIDSVLEHIGLAEYWKKQLQTFDGAQVAFDALRV